MPNLTNSEQVAFNEDLNRYMATEVEADKRAEWVEQKVKDLMADGQEYSPFKPENIQEAISELCFADQIMLGSYMQAAFNLPANISAQVYLSDFLVDRVQDYWHECAVKHANELYDKAVANGLRFAPSRLNDGLATNGDDNERRNCTD